MELRVDERNQAVEGTLVATPPFEQQTRDGRGVVRNAAILGLFVSCSSSPLAFALQK
jgi:hypothetical protein